MQKVTGMRLLLTEQRLISPHAPQSKHKFCGTIFPRVDSLSLQQPLQVKRWNSSLALHINMQRKYRFTYDVILASRAVTCCGLIKVGFQMKRLHDCVYQFKPRKVLWALWWAHPPCPPHKYCIFLFEWDAVLFLFPYQNISRQDFICCAQQKTSEDFFCHICTLEF